MSCQCLGDPGYKEGERIRSDAVKTATRIMQAAAVLEAGLNATDLVSNYKKQRDISSRMLKISEEEQAHLKEVYWPRELEFLAEFGTEEEIEEAEVLGRRYAGRLVSSVAGQFAKLIADAKCNTPRYCTSARAKALQDLLLARAQATANARVLGRMIGFAEVQARIDRNFKRRMQAIGLGKGLMQEAARLYDAASKGLATAGQDIAARLNGALTAVGYGFRDPGPTPEMQRMWQQRNVGTPGAPGVVGVGNPAQGLNPSGARGFGLSSNAFGFGNDSTQTFLSSQSESVAAQGVNYGIDGASASLGQSYYPNMQAERMNEADVGNRDRVRTGSKRYNVIGGKGYVMVDMDDFAVQHSDHMNPGDKKI